MNVRQTARGWQIHKKLTVILQLLLLVGAALAFYHGRYLVGTATLGIMLVTLIPVFLDRSFQVRIPAEFEFLAVVFIYSSLFLGEVHGYYVRYWWWDVVLHTGSGFLLGIMGFLLVYILNEKKDIAFYMKPGFVALFAFMFALGFGALWEVFEFTMDQSLGLNMQKSGLVDTMWDLIVDAIGALTIALLGYGYMRKGGSKSFLHKWIYAFIIANPRFFGRDDVDR
jgi:hypothetical protein